MGIGKKSAQPRFFVWQIILLLQTYIARAYLCGDVEPDESQTQTEPKLGDENDFTIASDGLLLDKFIYSFLPYYLITSLMVCANSLNPGNNSTLISCYYLILMFNLGIRFRRLYTKNLKVLRSLRTLNLLFLIGQLLF